MNRLALEHLTLGPSGRPNHVYVLSDGDSGDAVVIDPAWDADALRRACEQRSLKLCGILLTHSHGDHCNAADDLASMTGAPIHISTAEALFTTLDTSSYSKFEHGMTLGLGTLPVTCILTPGHTPGSACFLAEDRLFTGDTLFHEGCGYTHLKGGNAEVLFHSLQMLKEAISPSCRIYPGHTFRSPLGLSFGRVREKNPYLRFSTPSAFSEFSNLRTRFGKPT